MSESKELYEKMNDEIRAKKPKMAICYDFDKTLSPDDMQTFTLIPSFGIDKSEFWQSSNKLAKDNLMDTNLAWMHELIRYSEFKRKSLKREYFRETGADVKLYKGVKTWFKRMNEYAEKKGIELEHYIISSGLKEIIEGSEIAQYFKRIYASTYLNGMLTNEEVIEEMLKLAKQIAAAQKEGDKLGLTADELAFYDALTKPQAIKDFYENDELIAITKELADTLRKNKTIDWQKRESARAKMRMLIKKLLKKHKYPPEGMEDAVQTVMTQCELWTDNMMDA